jgi:hypothetical protein
VFDLGVIIISLNFDFFFKIIYIYFIFLNRFNILIILKIIFLKIIFLNKKNFKNTTIIIINIFSNKKTLKLQQQSLSKKNVRFGGNFDIFFW